jgi:hypothetical protein
MVTFECLDEECPQFEMKIDFAGDIKSAECGGCHVELESFDFRADPELGEEV